MINVSVAQLVKACRWDHGTAKLRVRSSAAPEELKVMQISFPGISYSHNNKISNNLKVIKGLMKEKRELTALVAL